MLKFYQLKANDNLKSAALQWPGWFLRYYAGNGHTYHRFRSPEVHFAGNWTDLLYAEEGWLVASDALRKALEAEKKPEEIIHFLPLQVSNGNETRAYWLVHFPYRKDVYAWRKWQYDDEMALIHQPPLDEGVVKDMAIFCPFHRHEGFEHLVIVHDKVKSALESTDLSGLAFEQQAIDD